MSKFVVSVNNSDDELKGYYSSTTPSDGLLIKDLNEATIFLTKAEARTIAGRYQALNGDDEASAKQVEVTVKLS